MRKNSYLGGGKRRGEWKWMNRKEQESHVEKGVPRQDLKIRKEGREKNIK